MDLQQKTVNFEILKTFERRTTRSKDLHAKASRFMPGGVSSTGRWSRLPYPILGRKARGSRVYDVDENEYIDFLMSLGALILGHGHPKVIEAVRGQMDDSLALGTLTEIEVDLARKICSNVRSAELLRFTNSGTEAVMYCLRVARAFTKRDKIAKFEGGFHGNHDYAMVSITLDPDRVGKENKPMSVAMGAGIPKAVRDTMLILPYNNIEDTKALIVQHAEELAAVIVEPVLGFGGALPANKDFLYELRKITQQNDVLLIFDEVITGFRMAIGGAQELYGIVPDLVTLGKIIGGGMPIGAYAGKREIMEVLLQTDDLSTNLNDRVFQSGTFNGHPLAMAAGLATISELEQHPGIYSHINNLGEKVRRGLEDVFEDAHVDAHSTGAGSIFNLFFTEGQIRGPRDIMKSDMNKSIQFGMGVMNKGIYLPPLIHGMISSVHTAEDVETTLSVAADVIKQLH